MGSKERTERLKAEVHKRILDAAMDIVINEGCEAVSVRKIADIIEYSPPIIYSYFLNKEAVLIELSKRGFGILINKIHVRLASVIDEKERMVEMLIAYFQFATEEIELYQLMFAVGTSNADVTKTFPGLTVFMNLFRDQMQLLVKEKSLTEESFRCNYLICVSFIHGFATLNRYHKDIDAETRNMVLKKAVGGIISAIEAS